MRRFEVFTGEGRRRKWVLADKMALVAEMASTDNISELARRHGLRPSQLFTWRRELRYAAEAAASPPFVPTIVAPAPVAEALRPRAQGRRIRRSRGTATAIELEIDGVSVKIARDADATMIAAVIEALKMAR